MAREAGEPQLTFNFIKAFTDFINNFCFARGVTFRAPAATSAIVPGLLNRVWTVDNERDRLLWEMGQMAGVTGDCFVKIAYQEPQMWPPMDPLNVIPGVPQSFLPGRVRILPLNSSYCFPIWNPHDRTRLIQFTQKYRFWCADTSTEALTRRGWLHVDDILPTDEFATLDPGTDEIQWQRASSINRFDHKGPMHHWKAQGLDALTTPNHRWIVETPHGNKNNYRYEREIVTTDALPRRANVIVGGGTPMCFPEVAKWSDELVETVGWYLCDGSDHVNRQNFHSVHMSAKKPHKVAAWRRLAAWWTAQGATWNENKTRADNGQATFYLGKGVADVLWDVAPQKKLLPEFICSLTYHQAELLYRTLIAGDGYSPSYKDTVRWTQVDQGRVDGFQMLCSMLGRRNMHRLKDQKVQMYSKRHVGAQFIKEEIVDFDGEVWCPTTPSGTWLARRNGTVWWTGNSPAPDGTRQMNVYVEVITDTEIHEYVNDVLIEGGARPNPLGFIPVVHIPNTIVSGSPWGLPDCQDILGLNRTYNEVATEVLDIVNYYTAPVTVISGSAPSSMIRGAANTWSVPKGVTVDNLEGGQAGVPAALQMLDVLERKMHAMVGVPEGALGQQQPISNTAGVAVALQYQPMMQRYDQKKITFGSGLVAINELILRTLAIKEPETALWSPESDEVLKPGQLSVLDWTDPLTYRTEVHWPSPLPVDLMAKLQEIMQKMSLGLESKRGALADLGEEFPDQKARDIFEELYQDMLDQGVLDMARARISAAVVSETGMLPPDGSDIAVPAAGGPDVNTVGAGGGSGSPTGGQPGPGRPMLPNSDGPEARQVLAELNARAVGTKYTSARLPSEPR